MEKDIKDYINHQTVLERVEKLNATYKNAETDLDEHFALHNELWDLFVNQSDCTNKFAFNGKKVCVEIPKLCEHINQVRLEMKRRMNF